MMADGVFIIAGPRSALGSAVGCGVLLGVFEGELTESESFASCPMTPGNDGRILADFGIRCWGSDEPDVCTTYPSNAM